jgi:HAD superfamily hydrolase (TIGR01450 family)
MGNYLPSAHCFLLDLDGTLIIDNSLLPGAVELLRCIKQNGKSFCLITNNSSKSKNIYLERLANLAIQISPNELITSGEVTGNYLLNHYPTAKLFILGTQELIDEIQGYGYVIDKHNPDVLVLGFDTSLTYEKLNHFCCLLNKGLPYLATHSDVNCPTARGFIPDIGSMMAMIHACTRRAPDVILGKPHFPLVDFLVKRTGFRPDQMCMIGDRLYTDMAMAQHGMHTILVLTGETKLSDLNKSSLKPDLVAKDLWEIINLLR